MRHRTTTSSIDISSVAFWTGGFDDRERSFARLRADEPVSWHPPLATPGMHHSERGFWAVTTVKDIRTVSRDSTRFSSAVRQVSVRPTPFRIAPNMLVTDPPLHTRYRSAAAAALSPSRLRRLRPRIDRAVRQIVLRSTFRSEFDVVTGIAAGVPARVLALLLGIPISEIPRFVVAVDAFASAAVPSGQTGEQLAAWFASQSDYLDSLIDALCRLRRRDPDDDLISLLIADGDGNGLNQEELRSTVLLLIVAGHDTMKQLITLSVLTLLRHPDHRVWLAADFASRFDVAFDELVRFTSPVLSFARTATEDLRLGDASIAAGDKIALFYCSGNRDEAEFDRPGTLRFDRPTPRHVGFGGGGVHFCLGGALARVQLRAVLSTLFERAPDLHPEEPVFGFDDAVHRVDRLVVHRD